MATKDRGLASMSRSKRSSIARKGGRAAHEKGTAHEWTSRTGKKAGSKGGLAARPNGKRFFKPVASKVRTLYRKDGLSGRFLRWRISDKYWHLVPETSTKKLLEDKKIVAINRKEAQKIFRRFLLADLNSLAKTYLIAALF